MDAQKPKLSKISQQYNHCIIGKKRPRYVLIWGYNSLDFLSFLEKKYPNCFYLGDLVNRTGDREVRSVSGRVGISADSVLPMVYALY